MRWATYAINPRDEGGMKAREKRDFINGPQASGQESTSPTTRARKAGTFDPGVSSRKASPASRATCIYKWTPVWGSRSYLNPRIHDVVFWYRAGAAYSCVRNGSGDWSRYPCKRIYFYCILLLVCKCGSKLDNTYTYIEIEVFQSVAAVAIIFSVTRVLN